MGRLMGSTSEHPTVPPNQPCGPGFSGKGKEGGRIGADTAKEKSSTLGVDFSVAALPSPMDLQLDLINSWISLNELELCWNHSLVCH